MSMHRTDEKHNPEWRTPFARTRPRWEDNIQVKLKGLQCGLYTSGPGKEPHILAFVKLCSSRLVIPKLYPTHITVVH
jgi:hypothetical protein